MLSRIREFRHWILREPRADVVAVAVLLSLSAFYAWLTWARCPLSDDKYWHMQVAARVAAGEVLYRDVTWIYGPLPVYILGLLYRLWRVDVIVFPLLGQTLAAVACLLTYRAARFLLSPLLALLSTVVLFLAGPAQFFQYIYPYTGAVSLGAMLGALFVVCLLSYLKSGRSVWIVMAGIATGGACLTKPEFALACAGTGILFLTGVVLFPARFTSRRDRGMHACGIYAVSVALTAGIGYGVLVCQAGWPHVWAGVTGYGQAVVLIDTRSPWGTLQSWCYIASGLGMHLLLVTILVSVLIPATMRKHVSLLCGLVALGLALSTLPWGVLLGMGQSSALTSLLKEINRALWAPGTLLSMLLIVALSIYWLKAGHRRQTIDQKALFCGVLIVYSILAAARYYFNPTGSLLPHYVNTVFPVFVFSLAVLVPRALERWGQTGLRRSRGQIYLAAILLVYAAIGFIWDVKTLSSWNLELATPRGTVFIPSYTDRSWTETLQYIISHTDPQDSIVVLRANPGFYFLSGRGNPLRQDFFSPVMHFSSADANEAVRRIRTHEPKLVIVTPRDRDILTYLANDDANTPSEQTTDIVRVRVWQYMHNHYQVRAVIGEAPLVYIIYELDDS